MAPKTRRPTLLVVGLVLVAAGSAGVALWANRGGPVPLPTLSELGCRAQTTMWDGDYVAGGPTETPETVTAAYVALPDIRVRQLEPVETAELVFDHTVRRKATRAVVKLDSPTATPDTVLEIYRGEDRSWRLTTVARCGPVPR